MAIPVTFDDARRQLRLRSGEVDPERTTEIQGFIADAAAWVEDYTGLILAAREVDLVTTVPASSVELRGWPIKADAEVTVTIDGTPSLGVQLDVSRRPARIFATTGTAWPMSRTDQVLIATVRAGFEAGDPVPGNIRRAMLLLIAAFDQDREGGDLLATTEKVARRLCSGLRLRRV